MSDLIDRQMAIDALIDALAWTWSGTWSEKASVDAIKNLPSVDAIPVVRCKDFEYYTEEERWCRRLGLCGAFDQNDYCSHAERRTDDCN